MYTYSENKMDSKNKLHPGSSQEVQMSETRILCPGNEQPSSTSNKSYVSLPRITSTMTPSIFSLEEKKKRKIETEFGTIIIDSSGITIHSDKNLAEAVQNVDTTPTKETAPFPSAKATPPLLPRRNSDGRRSSIGGYSGSRMYSLNTAKTSSRVLETVSERHMRLDRGVWSSDRELLMVATNALLGLGSIVVFPRLWVEYGGAAFLLAFVMWVVVLTLPLFMLEAALGQYAAHGVAALMPQMAPALKGYSYAMVLSLAITSMAYMPDVSSAAIYGADAARRPQPWHSCQADYSSALCYTHELDWRCRQQGALLYAERRCVRRGEACRQAANASASPHGLRRFCVPLGDGTLGLNITELSAFRTTAGDEYFNHVPHRPATGSTGRSMNAPRVIALLACWVLAGLMSQRGISGIKYTIPFLLVLPIIVVTILTFNLMFFGGAFKKIWQLLIPDVGKLGKWMCWYRAATTSMYAMNVGTGINTFIYSRNLLTHDCKRSAVVIVLTNLALSIFFGLTYSIVLGNYALKFDMDISELLRENEGKHPLIMMATLMGALTDSQTWSLLLFMSTVLMALGCVQVMLLTIDISLRELSLVKTMSTRVSIALMCTVFFLLDVLFTVQGGYYAILSIQHYACSYYHIVLMFTLVVAVNSILGVHRLLDDICDTMAVHMKWSRGYWTAEWRFVCPFLLLFLLIASVIYQVGNPLRHKGVRLPAWTTFFSVFMGFCPLLLLIGVVFGVYRDTDSYGKDLFATTARWRPGLVAASTDTMLGASATSSTLIADGVSSYHAMSAAPSLMTKVYGAISSRHLLGAVDLQGGIEEDPHEDDEETKSDASLEMKRDGSPQ